MEILSNLMAFSEYFDFNLGIELEVFGSLDFPYSNVWSTDYGHPMKALIKNIWKIGQTKYALAVP